MLTNQNQYVFIDLTSGKTIAEIEIDPYWLPMLREDVKAIQIHEYLVGLNTRLRWEREHA